MANGKRKRRRTEAVPRSLIAPLPTRLHSKLIYSDRLSINPGLGTTTGYVYSCNGLYDPDIVFVGHQPRGFDQIMQMYDHYIVVGARVTFKLTNPTAQNAVMGVTIRDASTLETVLTEYRESNYTSERILLANSENVGIVVKSVKPGMFLGGRDPITDPDLKGNTSNNPVEQCYFHLWAASLGISDIGALDGLVKIEYDVFFAEPKQPVIS